MSPLSGPSLNQHDGCEAAIDVHSIRTFLRQWMRDPVKTASVTPSGRQLARLMVAQLVPGSARVAELGAGTGVFTRALLDAGISPSQLLVVEINPQLVEFLRERFPGVSIACADARHLDTLAGEHGLLREGEKLDAVISGLGMLSMSSGLRCDILRAAFEALGDNGRFIQFTYGPVSPVRRHERELLGLRMRRVGFAMRNLPPATVYVYERLRSHEIASVRQSPQR
ncbi:MAG: methyltransferase domain-containing protein [Xanthomonadaceae bacterium]|nr:methyltransferase domain-containing protein [Xanthomonadaceae bacterium]MDE2224607.1 methyltransferase domain-containing protein [Xanthomonadaceae bacterium]